ncbi:c-type cytochrome [Ramlibacter sp. USB13]|uniref:C-type cytochrome n=1 Tax=Ramlibacter cellulosilyticus TaxID=2764187 RepID=A0A923MNR4_9BURK|nr:c-type cytochrome [Ramlibacter cellulosilyticus]MBC5782073.1 c-type cytochrome [Ramlibacter cellulosilyticus]
MRGKLLLLLSLLCGAAAAPAAPIAFQDTMGQRTLACTSCHGREGRAGPDGYYPRLAGKPAGYLYNQLLNFRDGRRHYGLMAGLLAPLSDAYLYDIALHFASLDVPYPPPQRANVPPEVLARGERLATQGDAERRLPACASCHGKALAGVLPNTPGLLGLPRDYLNAQLGAWRTGQRRAVAPDCMAEIARRLSPEDLSAVTAWLSSEAVPANAHPVSLEAPAPARRKGRKAAAPAPAPEPPPMRCGAALPPVAGSTR